MATICTDNINSYSDGDIIGNGNWTDLAGAGVFNVQGVTVKEGAKAIKATIANGSGQKRIVNTVTNSVATGSQIFYMRVESVTTAQQAYISVRDETGQMMFDIGVNSSIANQDEIVISNSGGGSTSDILVIKTGMAVDTWYEVECQWQASDHTCRGRVNGGTWSNWIAYESSTTGDAKSFRLTVNDLGVATKYAYFDTFQETAYTAPSTFIPKITIM
jgi:hypothetical protein